MSTTTDLTTLKINYLTQAQYDTAKSQGLINDDELYLTPAADSGINDVTVDGVSVVTDSVAEITMPTVPTKVSDLTNDVGYITDYTETDPTVPSWAKASSKPSYTASEVGAVPTSRTINGKALTSDITLSASDVSALPSSTVIPTVNNATLTIQKNGSTVKTFTANASSNVTANITVPTATSDLTNDSGFITGYTETDPVFTASAAHGITSSDISTWNGKSTVSVTRHTTSGTNIADLTINGTTTKLYAPQGGSGTLTDVTVDGTSVVSGSVAEIDLTGKADVSSVPTKVSDLTNDAGYITGYTETDPTVPSWAKASSKPSYTASEVGAVPTSRTVNGKALSSNITLSASDVSALPSSTVIPSKTSDLTNDSGYITGYTETDPVFSASAASGITSSDISTWSGKYAKPSGGIPKTDLASAVQTSLGLADTALQSFTETDPTVPSWAKQSSKPTYTASEVGALPSSTVIPSALTDLTNDMTVSDFTNDAGYLTSFTETDPTVPSWAKESTKPSYSASEISGLVDFFYPVGSYYETSDTTFDPNTAWGGTWSLEAEGQVHVSAGSTYSAGTTYGSDTHTHTTGDLTLTDAQMAHGHGFTQATYKATGGAVANKAAFNTGGMSANATHTHKAKNNGAFVQNGTGDWSADLAGGTYFQCGSTTSSTSVAHTHSVPEHGHSFTQPTISINTNGSVSNLSGASSTRTAHNHGATGSSTRNSWQPSIAVNRWHRTA